LVSKKRYFKVMKGIENGSKPSIEKDSAAVHYRSGRHDKRAAR